MLCMTIAPPFPPPVALVQGCAIASPVIDLLQQTYGRRQIDRYWRPRRQRGMARDTFPPIVVAIDGVFFEWIALFPKPIKPILHSFSVRSLKQHLFVPPESTIPKIHASDPSNGPVRTPDNIDFGMKSPAFASRVNDAQLAHIGQLPQCVWVGGSVRKTDDCANFRGRSSVPQRTETSVRSRPGGRKIDSGCPHKVLGKTVQYVLTGDQHRVASALTWGARRQPYRVSY